MQTIVNCEQILFILSNYPQSNLFHIDKSFIKFRFSGLESDLGDAGKVWYHSFVRHYLPDGGWGFSDGCQVRTYNIVWIASCFCPTTLFKVFRFISDKVTFLYYVKFTSQNRLQWMTLQILNMIQTYREQKVFRQTSLGVRQFYLLINNAVIKGWWWCWGVAIEP